ncbi:ABC transporter ATP-binding protein, partial [Devosia sp.]|uniref:ABC transporter ATP-binding protein n=1 Tax=Devosia sp. TaxID=1871048 RepID=UPI003262F686
IGRAIVREPKVFLMDEPLSALDAKLREALRSELKDLQMRLGATFIFVTHDQVEAMTMGDRIGVLNNGKLVQVGTPQQVYSSPVNTFVASFVGSPAINLFNGTIAGNAAVVAPKTFELPLSGQSAGEGAYTFGIRPEDVTVASGAPVEAKIHDIENHGIEKIITMRVGDNLVRAAIPARSTVAVEETVRFGWNADKVILFDAVSGLNLAHKAA